MLSDFLGAITPGLRSYKGYLAEPSVITQYGCSFIVFLMIIIGKKILLP